MSSQGGGKEAEEDTSGNNQEQLFAAAKGGHIDLIVELLNDNSTSIDVNKADHLGNTALHYAAGANHREVVLKLLSTPLINVSQQNSVGDTPLHKVRQSRRRETFCLTALPVRLQVEETKKL